MPVYFFFLITQTDHLMESSVFLLEPLSNDNVVDGTVLGDLANLFSE